MTPHDALATFTPEEIAGREFLPAWRGYCPDEVRTFLRAVAEDVRFLQARLDAAAAPKPLPGVRRPVIDLTEPAVPDPGQAMTAVLQQTWRALGELERGLHRVVDRVESLAARLDELDARLAASTEQVPAPAAPHHRRPADRTGWAAPSITSGREQRPA